MSVTTPADEKLNEALEHMERAERALYKVLDLDTAGSDEYSEEFIELIEAVRSAMRKVRRRSK